MHLVEVNICIVAVFSAVLVMCTTDQSSDKCPSESNEGVTWPETNILHCARSTPYCLNENMEISSRCCNFEATWTDEPFCYCYQNVVSNPCPDHFDWKSNICIFVIENTSYPPQCPYEESLPFSQYVSVLGSKVFPIWMPVNRIVGDYGLDVLRWVEPTSNYKSPYTSCNEIECNDIYYYNGSISDKNCLIYHSSEYVEAVNCEEKHNAICAYKSLSERQNSFCSQTFANSNPCVQSNYSSHSKCFCQGLMKEYSRAPRIELHEPYQNLLYSSLNNTCYIGLQKVNGSYLWTNSNTTIKYSNWAEVAVFVEDYRYGAITPGGWIMTESEEETDCVLYETEIPADKGEIVLGYSEEERMFVLKLTSPRSWLFEENASIPMVYCFTDADRDALISKMEITSNLMTEREAQFYFPEHVDGPGTYWCEGFLYPDVVAKSSNKYLLRYNDIFTEEYVVTLKKSYPKDSDPITEQSLKEYHQLLSDQIQSTADISHYIVRVYKIISVDEINLEVTINFHLLNPNQSKTLTDYCKLSRYMDKTLADFKYIEMYGVDTCVGVQTAQSPSIIWPATPINTEAKPKEGFCVGNDGSIVNKLCSGNYIDGARWSDLREPCTIQESTNTTINLTNIINQINSEDFIDQIVEMSRQSLELTVFDIQLIATFFEKVSRSANADTESITAITNHLMKVPLEVLQKSQSLYNATDRILYQMLKILEQSHFGELTTDNVIILSDYISGTHQSAIVVTEDNGCYIIKIFYNSDSSDIVKVDGFKAALLLNEDIISMLDGDTSAFRFIVTVYKNSKLFNEMDETGKDTGLVIGVTFPDISHFTSKITTVYKIDEGEDDFVCSFWEYKPNKTRGYWAEAKKTNSNSFITCTYDQPKHFTLVRNKKFSITEELKIILNSQAPISEKLENASILLSNHKNDVQPIDINLVSDLMQQAAKEKGNDTLELVTDIINIIIDMPKDVLNHSQVTYNATGRILFYFEQILENCSASQVIMKSNIYSVVQVLTDGNLFYGFTIDNERNLNLLREEEYARDISLTKNLDTALLLSQDLLNQHLFNEKGYVPKIVITIFLKSSLFIDIVANPDVTTKVVGVSFPHFDDPNLNGKLTLLYNLNLKQDLTYTTCSVYQNINNEPTIIRGFWNQESDSELERDYDMCIFWKLKYFALIKNSMNITSSLETLLASNEDMLIILNKTSYITYKFLEFFQPIDVFYIAQILYKVKHVNETVLEMCLDIINHVMDIDNTVLKTSSEMYGATDMILNALDMIAEKHTESKEIRMGNIAFIIQILHIPEMYEIILKDCCRRCVITVWHESRSGPFDAKLTLSPNLIGNVIRASGENYIPRMVLKVFFSDVLFVDKRGVRSATQIFGISFPGYNQMLSNEINLKVELPIASSSDDYNCAMWVHNNEDIISGQGHWSYESRPRDLDVLNCIFYDQSYFALTDDVLVTNVTPLLVDISNANTSSISKLYRMQDISYYYPRFQPYDIYMFSYILAQCNELTDNGLYMLSVTIDNVLRTSKDVLMESKANFNALKQILYGINHVANFEESRMNFQLRHLFGVVVCQLSSDSSNAVILTANSIECTHEIDDASFNYAENVVASLILSKDTVSQAMRSGENAKMIVTVFFNRAFFNIEAIEESTLILGLSIPNIENELEGEIVALFNHTREESNYECSYWENLDIWKVSDGNTKDVFKRCTFSEATYYSLLKSEGIDITKILENILHADCTPLTRLQRTLNTISMYPKQFKANDIYLVSRILSTINEVSLPCLEVTANITSRIMNLPREVLTESQDRFSSTDWILYYIDRIAEKVDEETQIITQHFAIVISNNITAILVENCDSQCNVILLTNKVNLTDLKTNVKLNTIIKFEDTPQEFQDSKPSHIAVTVFYNNALFNDGCTITYENIGPIIGMVVPSQYGSFNGTFRFYYYTESKTPGVCAFWDYTVDEGHITKGFWKRDATPPQPQIYSCESKHSAHFALLQAEKNITSDLEDILTSNSTAEAKLDKVVNIISDLAGQLEAVDIYLISKILEIAMREIDANKMNITSDIISGLFNVSRDVLRESQTKYSATDTILHSIDEMITILTDTGIDPIVKKNFTVVIYDLKESDISGVLLEDCSEAQCNISPLTGAVNITEIVAKENLQTAIVMSEELRNQVRYSESSAKLVVTIYFSDVLFNEKSERREEVSMVCGVLLPGFNETFLGNLYIMFNNTDDVNYDSSCAYWNFQVLNGQESIKGSWSSEVDPQSKEHFTICEYEHITHFAMLLTIDDSSFGPPDLYNLLDIITAVESVLSVIGLLGILLTAALFERWRRNAGNQILVHFSIAISIKMVMIYVSAGVYLDGPHKIACCITGAILHYSILSEFCWMLIIAILQFKRFVEVLGGPPKFVLLKACICGWVFPILPVMLILLIDKNNYNEGQVGLCYPSGLGLYLGIWLPIIIIVSINFVIFIFIIYNVFHKKTESRDLVNHEILFQWRLALLLFSMLGLTWLFGFLAQIPGAGSIFVFLFCISATLQGFIMFLFFIVFNKSTRFLYSQSIKLWLYSRGYKEQ